MLEGGEGAVWGQGVTWEEILLFREKVERSVTLLEDQVEKNTDFREINNSTKTSEFVISVGNL